MIATTHLKRAQLIGNYRKLSEIIGDRPRFFRWGSRVFLDKSWGHRGWTQPGAVQPDPAVAEATDSLGAKSQRILPRLKPRTGPGHGVRGFSRVRDPAKPRGFKGLVGGGRRRPPNPTTGPEHRVRSPVPRSKPRRWVGETGARWWSPRPTCSSAARRLAVVRMVSPMVRSRS